MKYLVLTAVFAAGALFARLGDPAASADPAAPARPAATPPANPGIDMPGYLKVAQEAAAHRESRRVTEDEFVRMSGEPGTVVLDARSQEMYDLLHVKGAVHLSFPDIDLVSLPKVLPDNKARILIYCNNNFTPAVALGAGADPVRAEGIAKRVREAMRPKQKIASLNLSTYIALYGYGYRNVYELAPLIDPAKTKLTFESSPKAK
jgi:phage shock protein E